MTGRPAPTNAEWARWLGRVLATGEGLDVKEFEEHVELLREPAVITDVLEAFGDAALLQLWHAASQATADDPEFVEFAVYCFDLLRARAAEAP